MECFLSCYVHKYGTYSQAMNNTKEIILDVLSQVACGDTGTCQINLQSESAREMIAEKISKRLDPLFQAKLVEVVEQAVCGG